MNRPHIKQGVGCCAPAGMGTLLLLLALLAGCGTLFPPVPIVPVPDPVNPVVPVPSSGFKVLIVEETSRRDRLLPGQLDVLVSPSFRRSLAGMKAELRIWDQNVDAENESDAGWRKMLEQSRDSLPWIVISGKPPGFSGPLPKDEAETVKLVERFRP